MAAAMLWPLLAGLLCLVLVPLVRRYALRMGMVDQPGPRRTHTWPTPRGAGLAMMLAVGVVIGLAPLSPPWRQALLPALAAIAVLGFIDDHRPLSARLRLAVQILVSVWLLACSDGVSQVSIGNQVIVLPWLWNPLAVVALVWLMNLYNFMDGADGLAAGQGAMTAGLFMLVFALKGEPNGLLIAATLAAVCLAFLPWNLGSVRIFMGDAGSLGLGLLVGALALLGAVSGEVSIWFSLLLTAVFVVDATATLVDRVIRGERWYTPHRQHAYQRLIAYGWSHRRVLSAYLVANMVFVLPAALLVLKYPSLDLPLVLAVCGLLLIAWLTVRQITERTRRT